MFSLYASQQRNGSCTALELEWCNDLTAGSAACSFALEKQTIYHVASNARFLYAPFAPFYLLHLFDPFGHAVSHALVFRHHDKYCSAPVGFIEEFMQTFHLKLPVLSRSQLAWNFAGSARYFSADACLLYPQLAYEPEPSGRLRSDDFHPRR